MTLFSETETLSGQITEIEDRSNGFLIWFTDEPGEDDPIEYGVSVYRKDIRRVPMVGNRIVTTGHGTPNGLTYLAIDGMVAFDRTPEEAALYHEIRTREIEIAQLHEKLESLDD